MTTQTALPQQQETTEPEQQHITATLTLDAPEPKPAPQPKPVGSLMEAIVKATDDRSKSFDFIQRVAKPMALSGLFGCPTQEQAIAKIYVGEALGIHPAVAMQQIHIFDNKVTMSAGLMLSLARQAGWRHVVKQRDDQRCIIGWIDPTGVDVGDSSFSIEDAKRVKMKPKDGKEQTLLNKDNWVNYPREMCFARTVSQGVRVFCPEVTNGIPVYSAEEVEDLGPMAFNEKHEVRMPERASAKMESK